MDNVKFIGISVTPVSTTVFYLAKYIIWNVTLMFVYLVYIFVIELFPLWLVLQIWIQILVRYYFKWYFV